MGGAGPVAGTTVEGCVRDKEGAWAGVVTEEECPGVV